MTTCSPAFDLASLSAGEARAELIREVHNGLHSRPPSLKPWMLYDELGSRLFEQNAAGVLSDPHRTFTCLRAVHSDPGFEIESFWKDRLNWHALTLSRRLEENECD